MEALGNTLLGFAVVLAVAGDVALVLSRLGMSRLSGDLVIRGKSVTYFPLGLSIVRRQSRPQWLAVPLACCTAVSTVAGFAFIFGAVWLATNVR